MANCSIDIDNVRYSNVTENVTIPEILKAYTGDNETLMASYFTAINSKFNNLYDADFVKLLKDNGIDYKNINKNESDKVIRLIREFYNKIEPDVNFDTKLNDKDSNVAKFGYTSIEAREEGKRHVVNFMIRLSSIIENNFDEELKQEYKEDTKAANEDIGNKRKEFYANQIINKFEDLVVEALSNQYNEDDIWDAIEAGDFTTLDKMIKSLNNYQASNIYALYKEALNNKEDYFGEIFYNSRLNSINFNAKVDLEDSQYESTETEEDGTEDGTEENSNDEDTDTVDSTTKRWNDNLGDNTSNFMTNVDSSVKDYLGSLRKVNVDNYFGIEDVMDVNECCTMLYSDSIDYTSTQTMLDSITEVANNIAGFEAFHQIVEDCKADSDLMFRLYNTFAKFVVAKLQTTAEGETTNSKLINRFISKQTTLRFEYLNSAKTTSLINDDVSSKAIHEEIVNLRNQIKSEQKVIDDIRNNPNDPIQDKSDINETQTKIDNLVREMTYLLAEQLRRYYPTITDSAIANYIKNAHENDYLKNIDILDTILMQTINGSFETQNNYNSRMLKIAEAKRDNKEIKDKRNKIDISELYAQPYLSKDTQTAAFTLADELQSYAPVKTELNSRNVHGNQTSSIINNNMITNLMNSLKNSLTIDNYGKYKFQSRQYDFSNILVEHKEKDGTIINFGLFRRNEETNTFEPTEYAQRLLRARLFDGATNNTSSQNVLYSEMSKGDYVATSFINFFSVEDIYERNTEDNFLTANYFMRIPSDAPKNFIINAPKYSADGLFVIENKNEVDNEVSRRTNNLVRPELNDDNAKAFYTKKSYDVSLKQLRYHLTSKHPGDIKIKNATIINENYKQINLGDEVSITYRYKNKEGQVDFYVMKGKLQRKEDGQLVIEKPYFYSFVNEAHAYDVNNLINEHFTKQLLKEGFAKRTINQNHVLFKQLKQMFVQELTDAANALNIIFENTGGVLNNAVDEEGNTTDEFVFNKGFDNESGRLFAVYHKDKSGKVLVKQPNGKYKLTGKVFSSDRFVITKTDANGNVSLKNYGNEIIEEAFDFLYGGARDAHLHMTVTGQGVNIELTDNQKDVINRKLSEFIEDYINDTSNRLEQYREFIPDKFQTESNIAEFALNHLVMFGAFNDLFEGDTKFYADAQTFLKRAKEAQASGTPYGNVNYAVDMTLAPVKVDSRLNKTVFNAIDKNGNVSQVQYELKDKFVGITIKNSIRINNDLRVKDVKGAKSDGNLVKQLATNIEESFLKDGLSKAKAREQALKMARDIVAGKQRDGRHGYHGTKVNDAQSYITFDEWIKRMAAKGQFMKYKPLIDAILDESKPVDVKTIEQFIQVQKHFYYDQYYNGKVNTMAPRQIKNAEFVLVPRFIRGTQLEQVYQLMKDHGIDQLNTEETSKAGKANILTLWDNEGNITEENLKDFESRVNDSTEYFSYNYLYTQQEAVQHMDAENKAGIQIMKKIIDNIQDGTYLANIRDEFFDNYIANIKECYYDLMDRLGIELDEDGNIQFDEYGKIKGFDQALLFDMLKQEVARQGLDSNFLDYVTLNTDVNKTNGITVVPTYFGNKAVKLENISQAIFNSAITRQKLPGFHAAQVTSVGFRSFGDIVENYTYDKDLYYHPKQYQLKDGNEIITEREYNKKTPKEKSKYEYIGQANYIEIMMPASAFGMSRYDKDGNVKSNKQLLEELENARLDKIIGYRIPTEGKQSVCVMKVVGILDDAQGSTIVVPDDWVSQTGSDFDFDSVYGITFEGYLDKNNVIQKVEYHNQATISDYLRYLNRKTDNITRQDKQELINNLKKSIKEQRQDEITELQLAEQEIYASLPKDVQNEIRKNNVGKAANVQEIVEKNNKVIEALNNYIAENNIKGKTKKLINKFINSLEAINKSITNSKENWETKFKEGLNDINKSILKNIETQAYNLGLMTFQEFAMQKPSEFNTKTARNNKILQSMIEILSSDEAMEENFSRSNFEDIIDARDNAIDENVKKRREYRSTYNFLDQADYQEDVMSGAKLKAFSVTRDTFCSVCNKAKPMISSGNEVYVLYYKEDGYDLKQLQTSFGFSKNDVEEIRPGVYRVIHRTFGWSKNNRNVAGKLITPYSSQTTAHILDAVKEGAIPNVNDFTFQVYKMFPDIGSDYFTGVSFIMQDGVSAIVQAYNENKSIYSRNNSNPINTAFKRVAYRFLTLNGIEIKDNAGLDEYYKALKPFGKEFADLFGSSREKWDIKLDEGHGLVIDGNKYHKRLKQQDEFSSTPVGDRNRLLFDLGVIMQFNSLYNTSNAISAYTRVCNPDKFGAKQSIYSTEKIFEDINEITNNAEKNVLEVNGVSLLEAIYPGVDTGNTTAESFLATKQDKESVYPTLNAFLRYASATSVMINRTLFETQSKDFVDELKALKFSFSNGKYMTEALYKDMLSYTLNHLYGKTQFVSKNMIYDSARGFIVNDNISLAEERRRIYGYGKPARVEITNDSNESVEFTVKDINHPSDIEIRQFATLSPAQKIFWIQQTYKNKGVFEFVKVSLFNDRASGNVNAGAQTIQYAEGNLHIESIYDLFAKAFYNNNPLIVMAAADMIKYAFVVEGFKMKRNAINKMIDNDPLVGDNEHGGTNIINELNNYIKDIVNADLDMNLIRENFIRSHSKISQINTYNVEKKDKVYELNTVDDIIYLAKDKDGKALAIKYGFMIEDNKGKEKVNKYVKLRFGRNTILYKIINHENGFVAYPLNTLEANENSTFSVNTENNKFNSSEYYETVARQYLTRTNVEEALSKFVEDNRELKNKTTFVNPITEQRGARTFDINQKGTAETSAFETVIDKVTKHFSTTVKENLYLRAPVLENYIKYYGFINGSEQTINGKKYNIYKYNAKYWNDFIINKKPLPEKELSRKPATFQEVVRNAYNHRYELRDMYVVSPKVEEKVTNLEDEEEALTSNELVMSSVTEVNRTFVDDVKSTAIAEQDMNAQNIVRLLEDKEINASSPSLEANAEEVTSLQAAYLVNKVDDIFTQLNEFAKIHRPGSTSFNDMISLTFDDPQLMKKIIHDKYAKDALLRLILESRALVKKYSIINDLDIDSQNEGVRKNLNKIKDAINKLATSNAISALEKNFGDNYLAKLSDNPLVKQRVLSLLDGYHSASFMDAWVNDLQETSNPLIQLISKEVMADIRAKEMQAYKEVEKVKKEIEELKRQARAAGYDINWDNIVDKDGKIVRDYIEAFTDEIDRLRNEISLAKINYGENSKQYLEAQYEYNKFKLNYINQELVDSYYEERLALDKEMLDNYSTVFTEYKRLVTERNKILQHAKGGVLEGDALDEFKKIKSQIDNLVSDTYYHEATGTYIPKRDGNDPNNFFTDPYLRKLYSLNSANALRNYIEKNKDISTRYFEDVNVIGFEDELAKNLEIINSYEQRVNGRITTPTNVLESHDDYLKAKSWVEINARFVLKDAIKNKLDQAYAALNEIKRGRAVLSAIAKRNNLYDRFGQIKADELSEADIDAIRQEQLDNYGLREGQQWQDKSLLSNAPTDDTIFEQSFYQGMVSNGITNTEWTRICNEINTILGKHYDNATKTVYTSELTEDELEQLIDLYDQLECVKKHVNATNGKIVRRYIQNNVDFIIDDKKYLEQKRLIQGKTDRYKRLWSSLNERIKEVNGVDEVVPNRMLYGYAVPKGYKPDGTGDNSLVNYAKTNALRDIKKYTKKVKTSYYFKKFNEMSNKSEAEFNEWYNKNHIYNPYSREYEPLACWTTIEYISDDPTESVGSYEASRFQTESLPKDNAYNDDWKGPDSSTASNYVYKGYRNDITDYRNSSALNPYEKQMKDLVERIIRENAKTASAKSFFKQGYMIARSKKQEKDAKFYTDQALKLAGWINNSTGREDWLSDNNVDYAYDEPIEMPFTTKLKNKDSKKIDYNKPVKETNETETEYNQRYKEWNDKNKQLRAENDKIHGELLDRDFESAIEDFIIKSAHYNAVQDNKYMLFYAKNMLDKLDYYVKNFGFSNLQRDGKQSTPDETRYVTKKDTKLQEQYVNWLRRLVYDQWKRPNNKFTRVGNIAQSLTSAKFMMLNVTGGIANVTVGYTQIYAEMLANEYFGKVDGAKGLGFWSQNIGNFIADMYSDKASSLGSAIVNFFNVVDFDEVNGVVSQADYEEYMKRIRDAAFSPQAIGEHMMQNGALFSMCYSHRLVVNPEASTSDRLGYRLMNEAEYLNEVDEQALFNILTDEQRRQYDEFKQKQFKDPNVAKDYMQFRRYITVDFANFYLNDDERRKFIKQRRELQKQKREEFYNDEQHPTLMSQLKLDDDGKLGFNDDSILSTMGNDAYKLLGGFKGRVISVNKKIHGVYDKLGAAKLESYWWGGLVMQYHKHIYPGIMKRYRGQGYFNEERGTIEKGCYAAIKDFLSLPFQREEFNKKLQEENGATEEEMSTLKSIQNVVKNYVEFATHVNLYWNIIPENERGNIKRAIGDFAGALSAICTAIGLRVLADHDEEGFVYNLMMYEADRLASESMMYNPFGLISEGKKLWSSPVAVQGSITDMFHTLGFICQYLIQGDEFDDVYQSGMYAGEHKMEVFIKRNIPMYHSIYMLERLQKSNKYYKLGDNMLSIIPIKDIADFINK